MDSRTAVTVTQNFYQGKLETYTSNIWIILSVKLFNFPHNLTTQSGKNTNLKDLQNTQISVLHNIAYELICYMLLVG